MERLTTNDRQRLANLIRHYGVPMIVTAIKDIEDQNKKSKHLDFKTEVQHFMRQWRYTLSEFGLKALGDADFAHAIQHNRRIPTEKTINKVRAWMNLGPEVHAPSNRKLHKRGRPRLLPTAQDAQLWRKYQTGMTYAKIAKQTGVSEPTVMRHIKRYIAQKETNR